MGTKNKKMNKRGFIAYLAATNQITKKEARRVYNIVIDGVRNVMLQGDIDLSLMNFGRFYCQTHKGHPIQFESEKVAVRDYKVLRFSASNTMNRYLRSHLAKVPPEPEDDDFDDEFGSEFHGEMCSSVNEQPGDIEQ